MFKQLVGSMLTSGKDRVHSALPPMEASFRTESLEGCTALTLTLSPGERESAWPRSLGSTQSECPDAVFPQYAPKWSPSPGGEGWGEGESRLTRMMSRGQCLNAPGACGHAVGAWLGRGKSDILAPRL